jgi:hypothetical protein
MSCDKIFELYHKALMLHIQTKTNDEQFHKGSEALYESLFNAFHQAKEAYQDSKQEASTDPKAARKEMVSIMEEAKKCMEDCVAANKDVAVDDVLRGIVNDLAFNCGTAMSLCGCKGEGMAKEEDDKEEDEDTKNGADSDESDTEDTEDYDEGEDEDPSVEVVGYTVERKQTSKEKSDMRGKEHGPARTDEDEEPKKKMKYPEEGDMMG